MKNLLLIVFCISITHFSYSQDLKGNFFNVENSYEVGLNYSIGFELTSYPENFHDISYIEWRIVGGTSGFDVDGHMNYNYGAFFIENQNPPTEQEYFLDFAFGDNTPPSKKIKIIIDYRYYNEQNILKSGTMEEPIDVDVNTIGAPSILGPNSIQECCVSPVTYRVYNYDKANIFTWTVTGGGTIINGQGTDKIKVKPLTNNAIHVSCEVGRQEAVPAYKKTAAKNTSRFEPELPPIEGNDYLCLGEITTYYLNLDGICGVDDVNWIIPDGVGVVSENAQDGSITVSPQDNILYQDVPIKAVVQIEEGCITLSEEINVEIFESGTPPTPQGYIDVITDPDFDPCSDYILYFEFIQMDNFQNGRITVNPEIFVGVPHHIGDNTTIDVEVCYTNPCSGEKSCKTYTVNLPAPCEDGPKMKDDQGVKKKVENKSETILRSSRSDVHKHLNDDEIIIYPNPVRDVLNVQGEKEIHQIKLYDMNSEILLSKRDINSKKCVLNVSGIETGVYFMHIATAQSKCYKKVIIQ